MDTLETNASYLPLRGNIELNKAYRGILVKQLIKLVSNGEQFQIIMKNMNTGFLHQGLQAPDYVLLEVDEYVLFLWFHGPLMHLLQMML